MLDRFTKGELLLVSSKVGCVSGRLANNVKALKLTLSIGQEKTIKN